MKTIHIIYFAAMLIALVGCSDKSLPVKVFVNEKTWYKGTFDNDSIFVYIDKTDKQIIGKYFFHNNKSIVDLEDFRIKYEEEKNKYELFTDDIEKSGKLEINGDSSKLEIEVEIPRKFLFMRFGHRSLSIDLQKDKEQIKFSNSTRYKQEAFDFDIDEDIVFGTAEGYFVEEEIQDKDYLKVFLKNLKETFSTDTFDIKLDIYSPRNDSIDKRPLIALFHGGAFILGSKKSKTVKTLAEYYARHGYVVASCNYRLGIVPVLEFENIWQRIFPKEKATVPSAYERSVYRAVQDSRAAIRFLCSKADSLRIDTANIFIGGTSAGGVLALNLTFLEEDERNYSTFAYEPLDLPDQGGLDSSTNKIKIDFNVKATIAMWGGVNDINIVDKKTPLLLFHGDEDNIVPYKSDYPFSGLRLAVNKLFTRRMYGSYLIKEKLDSLNSFCELETFYGYKHQPNINPDGSFNQNMETIKKKSVSFLLKQISPTQNQIFGRDTIIQDSETPLYKVHHNNGDKYSWKVNGGKIVSNSKNNNEIRIVWFTDSDKNLSLEIENQLKARKQIQYNIIEQ